MTDSLQDVVADMRLTASLDGSTPATVISYWIDRIAAIVESGEDDYENRDSARYKHLRLYHTEFWQDSESGEPTTSNFSFEAKGHDIDAAIDAEIAALSPGRSGEVAPKLREMDDLDEQDDRDLEAWLGGRT